MFYTGTEARRAAREGRRRFYAPCRFCVREMNKNRMRPRQEYIESIKSDVGCADCGLKLPDHPEVFDFDHLDPRTKVKGVAKFLTSGTIEEMLEEIAKCEVVCANCHRIRTRSRGSNYFGKSK